MTLELGSVVEGTVTGITNFGAFVRLPDGNTGLVHISEVADEFVTDVRHFVEEQQTIQVKILSRNEQGKYDLSIKQVHGKQESSGRDLKARPPRRRGPEGGGTFEDMLSKWKKESEERLLDVKRNREGKRGGRGKGR